jgi:hypothetical protein
MMLSEKQNWNAKGEQNRKHRTSHQAPPMTTTPCQFMVGRSPAEL